MPFNFSLFKIPIHPNINDNPIPVSTSKSCNGSYIIQLINQILNIIESSSNSLENTILNNAQNIESINQEILQLKSQNLIISKKLNSIESFLQSQNTEEDDMADWKIITSDYTATIREKLLVDASSNSITVTLPASPLIGSSLKLLVYGNETVYLDLNGQNYITSLFSSGQISIYKPLEEVTLMFFDSSTGWIPSRGGDNSPIYANRGS